MSVLVVGSVALDSVRTPFGEADDIIGGSAVFFSAAASLFCPVQMVGVVGDDYPLTKLDFLSQRGVDMGGIEVVRGESFRWSGVYDHDLNSRETLDTRLGVFADFRPDIPEEQRATPFVFLGNIDPALQIEVLDQIQDPQLVVCDTMNFWIEGSRDVLLSLLDRVDILMINDSEARQLTGEYNLIKAARWIQERGPSLVVVKKGEHGATLFARDWLFSAPGYPLEDVFDPTGAGDAFAGGFVGYLAAVGQIDPPHLRRAMIYGSVMGSYAVEAFGPSRFETLSTAEIETRAEEFRAMTRFEPMVTAHDVNSPSGEEHA